MSRPWIKLYTEMLNEPKMILLTDGAYRRWVELLLYAAETDDGGRIGEITHIAIKCRVNLKLLESQLEELVSAQIVHEHNDQWFITSWDKRQPAITDAERQRKSRIKAVSRDSNVTVTEQSQNSHALDLDKTKIKTKTKMESKREKKDVTIPGNLDNFDFVPVWETWITYRKEIKKPIKATTQKSQLKKLSQWGVDRAVIALEHTMFKGWVGIAEPDDRQSNGANPTLQAETTKERLARVRLAMARGEL